MTEYYEGAVGLDLARYVRPGQTVIWGQACAEPLSLTEALVAQRERVSGTTCLLGIPAAGTIRPEHADHLRLVSYTGAGANRALADAGVLDVLPVHYSALPALFASRAVPVDVAFVQLPPAGPGGTYSLGLCADYLLAALDAAHTVVAEVNDQIPQTYGSRRLRAEEIDVVVRTSRPPVEQRLASAGPVEQAIASRVADLVEDEATVQCGIGRLPEAVLAALAGHRDLAVHSGVIGDAVAGLVEAGSVTGARRSVDREPVITGLVMGSRRVFEFVDANPAVSLRETSHTHDPAVLAAQHRFTAINSALEVDLTGAVNAETAAGSYLGAVGGAVDFLRGAHRSRGGLPVVALPSTGGARSRIVARLSGPVTASRADAGVIVTEHGVADLRGLPVAARIERMLAIAHPDHRDELHAQFEHAHRTGVAA